jgi:dimethylglycine dehydrogenase
VYHGDRIVGLTTGGAYGHAVNQSLAFAYVESGLAQPSTRFEILMMDNRCPAIVLPRAAWDPDNTRLRG